MQKPGLKIIAFLFIIITFLFIFLILYTGCDLYAASPSKEENSGINSKDDNNNQTPILYVTNGNSKTVTYFNALTGAYINGTLDNSSFTTAGDGPFGNYPYGVAVNPSANILYVTNRNTKAVTYLNATTGAYINGSLANSCFITGVDPYEVVINPSANILYVTNAYSDTVTYLNSLTGTYMNGTLDNSSFTIDNNPIGYGSYEVAVNPLTNILYITNPYSGTVIYFNALTGAYMNGTLDNSSFTISDNPFSNGLYGVVVNPSANILYVTNKYSGTVIYFNALTGVYINGSLDNSSFTINDNPIDDGSCGVAVNPLANILYVTNGNSKTVIYFNALTGAYINGTLDNSSFATGDGPCGITVNPTDNILYVINRGSDTVTYFNALTGAYINDTLDNSSFTTGDGPCGVALKP